MHQKLVVILAVAEDSDLAFERNDRCAAWASSQGWRLRRRLIIDGKAANDKAALRAQLIEIAESMSADILLTESLSQISTDGMGLTELGELFEAKSLRLVTLKECLQGPTPKTRLTAMLGAVCDNPGPLKLVFAGPKEEHDSAKQVAQALGWDLLFPRAKRIEQQLQSAPERALLLPSMSVLGDSAFSRATAFETLLKKRERIFIVDAGLDSAAPAAQICSRVQAAFGTNQTIPSRSLAPKQTLDGRPEALELLKQWIGRRRKTIRGSAVKYISQSGYSSSAFYRVIHEVTDAIIKEIDALCQQNGQSERSDRLLGVIGRKYDMSIDELRFAIEWSERAGSRGHSSAGATNTTDPA